MKTINYFSGSLSVLLFYALFVACNDDLQTISVTEIKGIEQTSLNESNALMSSDVVTDSTMLGKGNTISNSTSATNAFFTKQEYEEGMDWWKDREGALPALYEYQVSCRDFPSGHGPDTCVYYMTIIWTCYPPITEGPSGSQYGQAINPAKPWLLYITLHSNAPTAYRQGISVLDLLPENITS